MKKGCKVIHSWILNISTQTLKYFLKEYAGYDDYILGDPGQAD